MLLEVREYENPKEQPSGAGDGYRPPDSNVAFWSKLLHFVPFKLAEISWLTEDGNEWRMEAWLFKRERFVTLACNNMPARCKGLLLKGIVTDRVDTFTLSQKESEPLRE